MRVKFRYKFHTIIIALKIVFITMLILELIAHSFINFDIGKFFIDTKSLVIILLIISLLIEKHFFSIILLLYGVAITVINFSPMFMSEKTVEKIYYEMFLGLQLSSYIRNNVANIYWIVNPIMNLSFYLAGFIILLEIPYRQYKKKLFPFKNRK